MDQQNPYAAPQTTELADEAARLLTIDEPDFQPVAQGAGYCHDALMTMVSLVIGCFVLFWFYQNAFIFTLLYIVPIVVVIAWLLQIYGLVKLRQVPRESRSRGLFTAALVLFVLSLLSTYGMWLTLLDSFPNGHSTFLIIIMNSALFRAASLFMLLWGTYRVGRFVQRPEICRWSLLAFACLVFVTMLESIRFFPQAYVWLDQTFNPDQLQMISKLWNASFVTGTLLGLVFYSLALKSLMRLEELVPVKGELSSLIELSLQAPSNETARPLGEST